MIKIITFWGGGPTSFLPMGKMCLFPFFPMGKNEKKVYGKRGKRIHFPLFPYTFFPWGKMGKNRKRHNFPMGKNGVGPPTFCRALLYQYHFLKMCFKSIFNNRRYLLAITTSRLNLIDYGNATAQ